MSSLAQARGLYAAGRLREAAALLGELLRRNPADADSMQLLGVIQFQNGYHKEGIKLADRATQIAPQNSEAWNNLGLMRHMSGDWDRAYAAMTKATDANPNYPDAWKNRAFLLQEAGEHEEALECLEHAGESADVHFFKGNSLAALERYDESLTEFDQALERDPKLGDAWFNKGNSLLALDRPFEAMDSFREAQRLLGRSIPVHRGLAMALHQAGRSDEALAIIAQVRQWDPDDEFAPGIEETIREAIASMEAASFTAESEAERLYLARELQSQGKWSLAVGALEGAESAGARFMRAIIMPAIFESAEIPQAALNHLKSSLAELEADVPHLEDPLGEVGMTTFHLPYFGVSDRSIQERICNLYREADPSLLFEVNHTPGKGSRKKVGILSALLNQHTISRVFGGLIERLDKDKFEVVYLQLGPSDKVSERLAKTVDRHVNLDVSLASSREQVAAEELDVLFYPEIGMDPQTYYLSMSRLAPVQVTTWGHPFTTGSPVMDYYLSSENLDRDEAQTEYTEKLVRLPSLGMYYQRPQAPPQWERSDFGLPDDKRLYGCPQMPFKFHPDFDRVLNSIVELDDKAMLVLIEPQHANYKNILLERWSKSAPALAERIAWLPPMPLPNFLRLLQLCDSILTPIHFGAGRSSFDAFGVGAPVVTYEGEFLKSRITYAAYREMGISDLVANTEDQYVSLALRLAQDTEWQNHMRKAVSAKADVLFESKKAVNEFNAFFADL